MKRFQSIFALTTAISLSSCAGKLPPAPHVADSLTEATGDLPSCSKAFITAYNDIETELSKTKFEAEIDEVSEKVTAFDEKYKDVECEAKKYSGKVYEINANTLVEHWNKDLETLQSQLQNNTNEPITD